MKLLLALALALTLASCASTTTPVTPASTIVAVQQACVTISPVVAAATGSPNTTVATIASYANAVCGPLAAGAVPPTVTSSTPAWLGAIAGMIQTLLPVAVGLL